MWCGVFGKSHVPQIRQKLGSLLNRVKQTGEPAVFESSAAILISGGYFSNRPSKSIPWKYISEDGKSGLVWSGELYGSAETVEDGISRAGRLWNLYRSGGTENYKTLNGAFTISLWDEGRQTGVLAGDHFGILPAYYAVLDQAVVFGSIPELVLHMAKKPKDLDYSVLLKFLTFCYNPGFDTVYRDVRRLRPGHFLEFQDGRVSIKPFWRPRFDPKEPASEKVLADEVRNLMAEAVRSRVEAKTRTGVFLSGGLDSSSIVSLLSKAKSEPVHTFSFRCRGQSFDESHYAQKVADTFGTRHTLVEYRPEDVLLLGDLVVHQDEPFCDAGINVATFLLGRAAMGQVDDLFTGDGGDELFAGHPVYAADRAAAFFRKIPKSFQTPFLFFGRRLHDSDRKKDWRVKIKRFSAGYAYPDALGTYRWRAYYRPSDLKELLAPELWEEGFDTKSFEDILQFNSEGENPDPLAKSLYADYSTVVHFYLRRVGLLRPFGLRPKFPLLDPDLVEFCAAIPSTFKIRGRSESKYIEKLAVEPLLPREIVHRKDKLGHSIPLKNWMRDDARVRGFMRDVLSESEIRRRGLFRPERVQAMIREHLDKKDNHAHRLWALMVLELWMKKHLDQPHPVNPTEAKS
jgi:asparagine synthase (glutamine-hydrolysing)